MAYTWWSWAMNFFYIRKMEWTNVFQQFSMDFLLKSNHTLCLKYFEIHCCGSTLSWIVSFWFFWLLFMNTGLQQLYAASKSDGNNMTELVSLNVAFFDSQYVKINAISTSPMTWGLWIGISIYVDPIDHEATFYSSVTTLFNNTSIHESLFLSVVWCLDYQYTAYGDSQGQLNVYMLVNGERDEPLVSRSGSTSSILHWYREQIILHASHYSSSDMIEVRWKRVNWQSVRTYPYWPKQTAVVQTAAVCVTSLSFIYKLLRSGCGQAAVRLRSGCGQAAVRLRSGCGLNVTWHC